MKAIKVSSIEEALGVVKQNPHALAALPRECITLEVCLTAVQLDGWALQYVPEAFKTPELRRAAVRRRPFCDYSARDYDEEEFQSPAFIRRLPD